jgi:hypothetical protein
MRHHSFTKLASILVVCLMAFSSAAFADEAELMALVKNMQKQMNELQTTVMSQKAELQELKSRDASIQIAPTSVEATPPMSETEFKQRMSDALGGSDKWLKDLKFSGDLRLRYEAFHLHGPTNAAYSSTPVQPDRNRFRIRLRYGFEKTFSPEMKVGFSMATGSTTDPISQNQTLTNDFNYKSIQIDKAYATYTPNWAKVGPVSGLEVTAGKFNNPFEKGSTDMIWDPDLRPEGIYEKADLNLLTTDNLNLTAYLTAGQFILNETANVSGVNSVDSNLWAFQAGLTPKFYVTGMDKPIDALSAISLYDYQHFADHSNFINTANYVNGNLTALGDATRLDAGQFNILSFYQDVGVYVHEVPVRPFFEFARNMDSQASLTTNSNNAWSTGLKVGQLKKKHDWQASYQYKWIGASSVVGAFNDSDFGGYNYGGAGKAGSVIKLGYNLTDYLALNAGCFLVSPLSTRATSANGAQVDQAVRRFQLDMVYKF